MGASRWVVLSLILLAGIFAVVPYADRRGGTDTELAPRGTLAEFRPERVRDWDVVGSIPAEATDHTPNRSSSRGQALPDP